MTTVSQLVDQIRLEMNDQNDARWSDDDDIINIIKKAVYRIDAILYRNNIEFFQKDTTITTSNAGAYYSLPSDFGTPLQLSRDNDNKVLTQLTKQQFRSLVNADEADYWLLKDVSGTLRLVLAGTPTTVQTLTLDYYPKTDTSAWSAATAATDTVPYGGRLDYIITDYAKITLQNIEEMDASFDVQLLQDLENNILTMFSAQTPLTIPRRGWNSGNTAGNFQGTVTIS